MADVVAAAAARVEFQRKQRDRKRLYRARLKDDMTTMRAQVSELEATYETLYAERVAQQQRQQQEQTNSPLDAVPTTLDALLLALEDDDINHNISTSNAPLTASSSSLQPTDLQHRYTAARAEMASLRRQIDATKKQLSNFDLFNASLECYLSEFQSPAASDASSSSSPSPSPSPLSSPSPVSPPSPSSPHPSSASAYSSTQPAHTLRSPLVAQLTPDVCQEIIRDVYQQLLARKWTGRSVSSGAEMLGWTDQRFVDGATLQFALSKTFQSLNPSHLMHQTWDILTTERHMKTLQRSTTEVSILSRISDDIVLLERRANHKELGRIACVHLLVFRLRTPQGYIVAFKAVNPPGSPHEMTHTDVDGATSTTKPKLAWVDTMQWFKFDDLRLHHSVQQTEKDDERDETRHDDAISGTRVTIAGRTANCDAAYSQFFLFEVVTFVVRWESAVAGARLLRV